MFVSVLRIFVINKSGAFTKKIKLSKVCIQFLREKVNFSPIHPTYINIHSFWKNPTKFLSFANYNTPLPPPPFIKRALLWRIVYENQYVTHPLSECGTVRVIGKL